MRTVIIDRAFFNIPSDATVTLYECDKYGNAIGLNRTTIETEPSTISLNSRTNTFKTTTSDILAQYALYILHITLDKNTQKIPLFIFDGEGALTLSDIISPIYYESVFNVMSYAGEGLPVILQDCVEKLDAWFASPHKTIYPRDYKILIETFMLYAERYSEDPTYHIAPCLSDFDAVLANYMKES